MSLSQTPAYHLKVVLKETGVKADSLRAWATWLIWTPK